MTESGQVLADQAPRPVLVPDAQRGEGIEVGPLHRLGRRREHQDAVVGVLDHLGEAARKRTAYGSEKAYD